MSDCFYECDWHELPAGLQKSIVFMIRNAQKPIQYKGFGIIRLNLETFCDVRVEKVSNITQLILVTSNYYRVSCALLSVCSSDWHILHDV